ncbi:MAG: IS4 family transposase [Blastocatellia bacterium]|nr:IS4 family transposase [Blastocatellia bacterium]
MSKCKRLIIKVLHGFYPAAVCYYPRMLLASFLKRFVRTLIPEPFRHLARQTGWSRRKGKIDPFEFLSSLTFGQMSASRPTLSSQAQSLAEPVTRQGIDQRYNPEAVKYVKASFAHIMAETLDWSPAHPQAEQLRAHFNALYLLDSTSFDCPDSLKEIFPSCGGDGSPANIKVLLRYELIAGRLEPLHVLEGKRSDQGQALKAAERLLKDQLQLHDKGFHDAKAWQAAQQRGAYLLMPLTHSVSLWMAGAANEKEEELDLAAALEASVDNRVQWPEIYLGKKGHRAGPVRLVAFRLSPESAARHRQGLRESMRTQGRTPSAKALQLAGWLLLVTNAPAQKLPSSMMSYLYRLRWQVELIFRQTKSVLRLDKTECNDPSRVQCEIWARLICAVLLFLWHAHASAECILRHQCEVSFEKLIRLMQHWGLTIARAFLSEPRELLQLLRTIWKQILLNARKGRQKSRPTTWENLVDLWLNSNSIPA